MGEDLIENEIYIAKLFGSDLQGNDLYKLEPLKRIDNATFVKVNPEFKRGDILKSTLTPELTVIFDKITSITTFDSIYHNDLGSRHWWSLKFFRHATKEEKQEFFDELEAQGKQWNAEKLEIEDIPKPKFKVGDKVQIKDGISSKTHGYETPCFANEMDEFIGKELTVEGYRNGFVLLNEDYYKCFFVEDWLEPYTDEPQKGDLAIFWDDEISCAVISIYGRKAYTIYYDILGNTWKNAIKFESKEQYEKIIKR